MSDEQKRKVMHAQLMLTETGGISGADAIWPIEKGSAISIHAHLASEALATQSQIDALAHRLMPEIKKFFADEQIQQEFAEWQEKQNVNK